MEVVMEQPVDSGSSPPTFLDTLLARLAADAEEVVLSDDRNTYRGKDVLALVSRLVDALAAHGVVRGHRVALVAPTTAEAIAARYAAMCLGAVTVFCPDAGSVERLAVFLGRINADAVLVFPQTAAVAGVVDSVGSTLALGPVGELPDLLAGADEPTTATPAHAALDGSDEFVLIATGGTTGVSKASVRTVDQYTKLVDLGPVPGRRQLVCTPLAYIAQTMVDTVLMGGGHVVLREHFDPAAVSRTLEREKITHVALVEPLLVELLDCPEFAAVDTSTVVGISHVGADSSPSLRRRLLGLAGRPMLVNPYGASEFGVVSMLAGADYSLDDPDHLATSGKPLPFVDVAIVRDDGSDAGVGETGMICVRTPARAQAYSVAPPSSGFGADGWFRTGDIGVLDANGYLRVLGREADRRMSVEGAVFPVDIQEIVCAHPDVRYAVALPDPESDNAFGVAAVLQPDATATADDLAEHLSRIAPHLEITSVALVDAMPATEQGKPDRSTLLATLSPGGGRTLNFP
jgi:fatty-acyl-CoA synthase